jgi:hypothetical protein
LGSLSVGTLVLTAFSLEDNWTYLPFGYSFAYTCIHVEFFLPLMLIYISVSYH